MSSACLQIPSKKLRFFDIGVNATDPQFQGHYHSKQKHPPDLKEVWARSQRVGCERWLITGGDLHDSRAALALASEEQSYSSTSQQSGLDYHWVSTAGIHPTRSNTLPDSEEAASTHLNELATLITSQGESNQRIRAFGELGLDYDRLNYSSVHDQLRCFRAQLGLLTRLNGLPLFLHSRGPDPVREHDDDDEKEGECAPRDLFRILQPYKGKVRGVVHSFTGSKRELDNLLSLGLSIGINPCSLKGQSGCDRVRQIPLNRLMLETDSPWCDIRKTHAGATYLDGFEAWWETYSASAGCGPWAPVRKVEKWDPQAMVKGRNEPCVIVQVAFIVARIKGITVEELADQVWENTCSMFG